MNKILETKIRQKAKWVTKRYPELYEEDLLQEGRELIVKLQKDKGKDISIPYLLKALSFHFSNLMRTTNTRRNIKVFSSVSLTDYADLSIDKKFDELEDKIDRESFLKTIKNNDLLFTLSHLMNGDRPEEIAKKRNISARTVYRHVNTLTRLRKDWEK